MRIPHQLSRIYQRSRAIQLYSTYRSQPAGSRVHLSAAAAILLGESEANRSTVKLTTTDLALCSLARTHFIHWLCIAR